MIVRFELTVEAFLQQRYLLHASLVFSAISSQSSSLRFVCSTPQKGRLPYEYCRGVTSRTGCSHHFNMKATEPPHPEIPLPLTERRSRQYRRRPFRIPGGATTTTSSLRPPYFLFSVVSTLLLLLLPCSAAYLAANDFDFESVVFQDVSKEQQKQPTKTTISRDKFQDIVIGSGDQSAPGTSPGDEKGTGAASEAQASSSLVDEFDEIISQAMVPAKFAPGHLNVSENGLLLSHGLKSRAIGHTGDYVEVFTGDANTQSNETATTYSNATVHNNPDFGAVFADKRPDNAGGWIYVSNSEDRSDGRGGVGAFTFDKHGNVIDYKMILQGTTSNCGGGPTPWGTWISCEETTGGVNWQVDPTGEKAAGIISLGSDGGKFESFAYDLLGTDAPQYFVTEDEGDGALQRFRPVMTRWQIHEWETLYGPGMTDFLLLDPSNMTYSFTNDRDAARDNADLYYPNSEGIDSCDGYLYFVSKRLKTLYILNLSDNTYTEHSTKSGSFNGQPDQVARIIPNDEDLLFFTEEGGSGRPGIHARDNRGHYFTILEGLDDKDDETTGVAFSPDGKHLYFAMQDAGIIYDVTRDDGLPFHARTLNIRYHAKDSGT